MKEYSGAQILIDSLICEGVEVVFGYPGGVLLGIFDVLFDSELRFVLTRGNVYLLAGCSVLASLLILLMGTLLTYWTSSLTCPRTSQWLDPLLGQVLGTTMSSPPSPLSSPWMSPRTSPRMPLRRRCATIPSGRFLRSTPTWRRTSWWCTTGTASTSCCAALGERRKRSSGPSRQRRKSSNRNNAFCMND